MCSVSCSKSNVTVIKKLLIDRKLSDNKLITQILFLYKNAIKCAGIGLLNDIKYLGCLTREISNNPNMSPMTGKLFTAFLLFFYCFQMFNRSNESFRERNH